MKPYQFLIKFTNSKLKRLTLISETSKAMKPKIFFASLLLAVIFSHSLSYSQVPQIINYQGVLTDSLGNRLNGNYNMTFSIYDTSDGGTPLWTETQYEVLLEQGVFNVLLSIPDSVWGGEDELVPRRHLGVSISSEPEMVPRREIATVPYAYRAGSDGDWFYPGDGTTPSNKGYVYLRNNNWGVARNSGSTLYGNMKYTHINLGVTSTTGTYGQDYGYCTVGGGMGNQASGEYSFIGGGGWNYATGAYAFVGCGGNQIASGEAATIGGGWHNDATGLKSTVAGGNHNTASNNYATVGGGESNIASGPDATVAGGLLNIASGTSATVGGGCGDSASGTNATVGGGAGNTASGFYATIGGGWTSTASGEGATVPGGNQNIAAGDFSLAAGNQVIVDDNADHTFAFGNSFTTSASHAVIFHDTQTSIKVGIATVDPQRALHVSDVLRLESRSSFPSSPSDGDICVVGSIGSRHIYCYLNGSWRQLD